MEGLSVTSISMTGDAVWRIMETAVSAGSHGIGYWANAIDLTRDGPDVMTLTLQDIEAGPLNEGTKAETYREHVITAGMIRTAVLVILRDPERAEALGIAERLMGDDIDGPTAEAIVQVACHGKVVYG